MSTPGDPTRPSEPAVDPCRSLAVGPLDLLAPTAEGPLSGLDFVVKEVLDVRGLATTAGSPARASEQDAACRSTPVVEQLLAAGARCVGLSRCDELAFSLSGIDGHGPAPLNPVDHRRLPGGSSSGSAAAVASGLVPFALATDTGGSIRIPASYCGVVGLRTSHGAIATEGLAALAPSFDTIGWMADSARTARLVGDVVLPADATGRVRRVALLIDAFELVEPEVGAALRAAALGSAARLGLEVSELSLGDVVPGFSLDVAASTFTTIQFAEVDAGLGGWAHAHRASLLPAVARRFELAGEVTAEDHTAARSRRAELVNAMGSLLRSGTALVLPAAHGPAPRIDEWSGSVPDRVRGVTLRLTSLAGLIGAPALSVPATTVQQLPVGLSLMSSPGTDRALLALAEADELARIAESRP